MTKRVITEVILDELFKECRNPAQYKQVIEQLKEAALDRLRMQREKAPRKPLGHHHTAKHN